MRKRMLAGVVLIGAMSLTLTACGSSSGTDAGGSAAASGAAGSEPIRVGFAQTGSESGWRSAPAPRCMCWLSWLVRSRLAACAGTRRS